MLAIDPVCKMEVDTASAQWKSEYKGQTYYFCAPGCMRSFEHSPEQYLSGELQTHMDNDHEGHDHESHDHEGHEHHDHS